MKPLLFSKDDICASLLNPPLSLPAYPSVSVNLRWYCLLDICPLHEPQSQSEGAHTKYPTAT